MPSQSSPLETLHLPADSAILVVDEDPAFQLGLKTFLHEYVGFSQVFTAADGKEALDLIENEESIEIITLDYQMPDMNGIEVLEELSKSTPRHLSVTMITGYPSEELEEEFRSFGSARLLTNYFLSKPVEFEKLEPLMLRAHEDLEVAKSKDEASGVINVKGESEPEDYIEAQLRHQSAKLDTIEEKVENLRKRWRRDFWTLVFIGAAIWAFLHFGWAQKLEPAWDKLKTEVSKMLPSASAESGDTAGAQGPKAEEPVEAPPVETPPAEAPPAEAESAVAPPEVTPVGASNSTSPPQPEKERLDRPRKAKNGGKSGGRPL